MRLNEILIFNFGNKSYCIFSSSLSSAHVYARLLCDVLHSDLFGGVYPILQYALIITFNLFLLMTFNFSYIMHKDSRDTDNAHSL